MEQLPWILDRRRAAVLTATALVLAAAAFAGLGVAADFPRVVAALRRVDPAWLALVPLGLALNYAGFVAAWRTVAAAGGGPRVDRWTAARVVVLRSGATLLVGGGALAVDGWALHRAGCRLHDVMRRVLALDFARFSSLCAVAGATAAVGWATGAHDPPWFREAWTACLAVLLAIAVAPARRQRPRAVPGKGPRAFLRDGAAAVGLARMLLRDPRRHPGTALGLPVFWLGNVLLVVAATRALGIRLGLGHLIVAFATAQLLLVLPLPVGASGGYEATLAWMLTRFGAPLASALPAAFVYRLCAFWVPSLVSFAVAAALRRLGSDLASRGGEEEVVGVAGDDGEVPDPLTDREHRVRDRVG
jgi:uncharacterized membrane protein YbhN (UPF0104 family)